VVVRTNNIPFFLPVCVMAVVSCGHGELSVISGHAPGRSGAALAQGVQAEVRAALPAAPDEPAEAVPDSAPPALISAFALDSLGNTAMILTASDGAAAENGGWERNYRLGFIFSKDVDTGSVNSALRCEPPLGILAEPQPDYSGALVYCFTEPPSSGVLYTVSLEKTVRDRAGNTMEKKILWKIRSGGGRHGPPIVRGLRFPRIPGSASELLVYTPENLFADFPVEGENYAFDRGIDTWMELYFETVSGADLDPLSLMERFTFAAANGAIGFSPKSVVLSSFTVPKPVAGWKNLCRAEIRGVLTNRPCGGMVTVEIGAGLKDSAGNKSGETQRFLFLK